jgi:hypothetical protein
MAIKKIAVSDDILPSVVPLEKIASSPEAVARFETVLASLKEAQGDRGRKISPKVDDFLYASCVMMHAAEASLIDQETGLPIKNANGDNVKGNFVVVTDHKGQKSVKWESADNIKPYKNGNGDIFPEEDLLLAYKEWVGKPLCRDHVSNSVDGIRGIIIDTHYDEKFKRVHALFALDRKNYADLARKVEAGYATSVSMGTAVGQSICSDCSNVATTEAEYCAHVQSRSCYGEVNKHLSPIELSIVVTGADPKAKIKTVLAHLRQYENQVESIVQGDGFDANKLAEIQSAIGTIRHDLEGISPTRIARENQLDINEKAAALLTLLGNTDEGDSLFDEARNLTRGFIKQHQKSFSTLSSSNIDKLVGVLNHLNLMEEKATLLPYLLERTKGVLAGADVGVGQTDQTLSLVDTDGDSLKSETDFMEESTWSGKPGEPYSEAPQNFASFYSDSLKTTNDPTNLYEIEHKLAILAKQIDSLRKEFKEKPMTFAEFKKRALERKSYFQGTEDDSVLPYARMGDDEKIRESEDKQMVGDEVNTSVDNPDESDKKLLQRAELEQRQARRSALLEEIKTAAKGDVSFNAEGNPVDVEGDAGRKHEVQAAKDGKDKDDKKDSKKDSKKDDKKDSKKDDKKDSKKDDKKDSKKDSKKDDSKKDSKKDGKNPFAKKDSKKDDKKDSKKDSKDDKKAALKSQAYFQGTEEPSILPYPLMGNQDGLRESADKQMLQTGPLGGDSGSVPGDEQVRGGLQRIADKKLSATFFKSATPSDSRWDFFAAVKKEGADKECVLSVKAGEVYGDMLNRVVADNKTLGDFFHSKQYGAKVLKLIRSAGPEGAAEEMGLEPALPVAPDVGVNDAPVDDLGELKDSVNTAIEKLEVGLEELKSAVSEEEGVQDLEVAMTDGANAMPPAEELAPEAGLPAAASVTNKDMLEAYAFLVDAVSELAYIESQLVSGADAGLKVVATSAVVDATLAAKQADELVQSYKVAKSVKVKVANVPAELPGDVFDLDLGVPDMGEKPGPQVPELPEFSEDDCGDGEVVLKLDNADLTYDYDREKEVMMALDEDELDKVEDEAEEAAAEVVEDHEEVMHQDNALDLAANLKDRLAKRRAHREALVAQAGQYDDVYEGEHGGPGPTLGLEGDDKVENLHEVHDSMLDVATKDQAGPKVREAASKLNEAIKRGGINPNKLNELVALGAVDSEVVTYWKTFYGQVDAGAEFAAGLVQEFGKSASLDNDEVKTLRLKRAFALGMEAQDKGLVSRGTAALNEFVDNMTSLPDAMFNSYKNIVAQTKTPSKGAMPQVRGTNEEALQVNASRDDSTAPTIENLASMFLMKK